MPITLSNGVTLNETGNRDARGNVVLADSAGNLYTNQGGKIVLSSPAKSSAVTLNTSLQNIGQEDFASILGITQDRLGEAFGNTDAFNFPSLGEFRSESEESIGEFFDKELELLDKSITQARNQETEKRDILSKRLGEDQEFFFKTEDKDFARALEAAQGGFAGRNTVTSGFRLKSVGQDIEDRELGLEKAETGFGREKENIDVDFKNFMDQLALKEEESKLDINRRKESATIAQQQLLQQQEVNRRSGQQSEALDFIREKLGA